MIDLQKISSEIKQGPDRIWYSTITNEISYPSDGNQRLFEIENNSFWFRHRNQCILSVVEQFPPLNNGTIFDIGGGNGFVSKALDSAGFDVTLVEPGQTGAKNAVSRGLPSVICATTESAGFKPNSLPAVGLFDVIEHIENDKLFLESLWDLMLDEGRLYITVPAYSFLWSEEDITAGHFRRYSLKSICDLLAQSGFKIEFQSYIFRILPVPIAIFRSLPYLLRISKRKKDKKINQDHNVQEGVLSKIINSILSLELKSLKKGKKMKFGGSCLIVAKKNQNRLFIT